MSLNPALEAEPLAGKRIVVTRAPEQSGELAAALKNLGAEVLSLPMVVFTRADSSGTDFSLLVSASQRATSSGHDFSRTASVASDGGALAPEGSLAPMTSDTLPNFEWILFTSQNAVRFFAEIAAEKLGRERAGEMFSKLKAGAVGPTTADAARQAGFRVDHVAKVHTGERLAQELARELKGKRVLVPRSDRADGRFSAALRDAGAEVSEFVAYRTAPPKTVDEAILQQVRNAQVEAVIFASPSAFHNLGAWIPLAELVERSKYVQFAAIGPTTARALREAGAQVAIEASDASADALTDAIVSYYKKHPKVARRA